MSVVMEVQLDYVNQPTSRHITAYGLAFVQGSTSAKELPATIALRLRWDRPWRKDKSLDYDEAILEPPNSTVRLEVHYTFKPDETKKVFAEIINKRTGKKIHSQRIIFSSLNEI